MLLFIICLTFLRHFHDHKKIKDRNPFKKTAYIINIYNEVVFGNQKVSSSEPCTPNHSSVNFMSLKHQQFEKQKIKNP